MLTNAQSQLARLMAEENLIVEQHNVETAYFELDSRKLVIPILNGDLSKEIYGLFISHEVGHALFTPQNALKIVFDNPKYSKVVWNICEDARIEKKMKRKYPGLRSSYIRGYYELLNQGFFGITPEIVQDLNFIDRINIHFKVGASLGIEFSKKEQQFVSKLETVETFEEALEISAEIFEYIKNTKVKSKSMRDDLFEGADGFDVNEYGDFDGTKDDGSFFDDDYNYYHVKRSDTEPDEDFNPHEEGKMHPKSVEIQSLDDIDVTEIRSITEESFRIRQSDLYNKTVKETKYANIPDILLENVIVPYKKMYERLTRYHGMEIIARYRAKYNKFMKASSKTIGYLVKEFELRKNADQYKRQGVAKSGDINMNKLYSYKFNEDIFRRVTVVPDGKSHGLVMYLDWSGSMERCIHDTIEQLLNLTAFCRKVNIPFDVYLFSSIAFPKEDNNYTRAEVQKEKVGDMVLNSNITLYNILSSKMTASEYTNAASILFAYNRHNSPSWFHLSGTPLNEAIVSAMKIVPEFRKTHRVQIVNTIFLTDGESSWSSAIFEKTASGKMNAPAFHANHRTRCYFRDPMTHAEVELGIGNNAHTKALLKLLKERVGGNIIGFYVGSAMNIHDYIRKNMLDSSEAANTDNEIHKFKKEKSLVFSHGGYDEQYLITTAALNVDDKDFTEVEIKSTQTRSLVSAFKKHNNNKIQSRVILNRFIELIA